MNNNNTNYMIIARITGSFSLLQMTLFLEILKPPISQFLEILKLTTPVYYA